ncbi:MAG TPA: cysteine desulfurase [Chitinophagales bacterium]|nr:cysteine desulfurase [Chitinophagales bacterium]
MSTIYEYPVNVAAMLDVNKVRNDFPILHQKVNGRPLVYLDNAATSQKPYAVINAVKEYYERYNSNIHRGAHHLAHLATVAYEEARKTVARHINANEQEINFVRGTTEAVNLVASTYGRQNIKAGDEIIISAMEHHSNIVPWQMLCEEKGAALKVIPVTKEGEIIFDEYLKLLSDRTRIVSIAYVSNALGTINPVKEIIAAAHKAGAVVFIDAAQAVPHKAIDVKALDCDFMGFSGHKVFATTGIGVLYGKAALLEKMPPYMGGGEMIKRVTFEKTTYNELPYKFEAGTPNIEGGIALGTALDYINSIGLDNISAYEQELLSYGTRKLQEIDELRIVGTAKNKSSVLSFLVGNILPYDLGVILNEQGIAIRTGHHCCQPLMDRFNIEGTCRASMAFYNTTDEIDALAAGIKRAVTMLR